MIERFTNHIAVSHKHLQENPEQSIKAILCGFVLLLLPCTGISQDDGDTIREDFTVNGIVLITNNGFAPIPAFSFEKPAAMAFLTLQKGRFTYVPDIAIGLDGDLWMHNHWFLYQFLESGNFTAHGGVNPNLFFNEEPAVSGERIIRTNRNVTFELAGEYRFQDNNSLTFIYRYNKSIDSGTISGHFIDLSTSLLKMNLAGDSRITLRPQIFYFDHAGSIDGLFTALFVDIGLQNIPISVFFQGVKPLWSNISPEPSFQWNTGIQYLF